MRVCFDSIESTVLDLPDGADLYAGYDDGNWPDAPAIAARFPGKTVVRITTDPADDEGDMLDVEHGDALPADAPGWVGRRRAAGHGGPLVYSSLDTTWSACQGAFRDAGIPTPGYWLAAYPGIGAELYPGTVGHQYVDRGTYDVSVVADYLPGIDPAPPAPAAEEESPMSMLELTTGRIVVAAPGPTGHLRLFTSPGPWPADAGGTWSVVDVTDGIQAATGTQYLVAT